ncbi:MAG TPA: GNAT family N-acetyltransferase [Myxococcaceae bacterium]|jgi:GNAT superfamily N-acetyltransferase
MFPVEGYRVVRLGEAQVPALQALHERCHVFLELVYGQSPQPDAAAKLLAELPEGKGLEDKFLFGLYPPGEGAMAGVLEVIRDFPERGEWFIGFLMLDPAHRNAGLGNRFVEALEGWVRGQRATGLRLIVQEQNPGALRFWQRRGYAVTGTGQQRAHGRENTVMRMRKALG